MDGKQDRRSLVKADRALALALVHQDEAGHIAQYFYVATIAVKPQAVPCKR